MLVIQKLSNIISGKATHFKTLKPVWKACFQRCCWRWTWQPLQYSCLEDPMDRGAWGATVHRVARVRHDLATKPASGVLWGDHGCRDMKQDLSSPTRGWTWNYRAALALVPFGKEFQQRENNKVGRVFIKRWICVDRHMDRLSKRERAMHFNPPLGWVKSLTWWVLPGLCFPLANCLALLFDSGPSPLYACIL